MQRIVLVFLLMLMPAQWTWAAAASICRHETNAQQASHFGHHEHKHEQPTEAAAQAADADAAIDAATPDSAAPHADCASCHGASTALVMQSVALQPQPLPLPALTPYRRSVTAGLPERLIRPPHPRLA